MEYDTGVVYFEDIPQFTLQLYILWKTPLQCLTFNWNYLTWDNLTYENWSAGEFDILKARFGILTSFLSITATVVPYCEKKLDENWELLSLDGMKKYLFGTFFNVIPKLILIAWTFSILKWYTLFFIIPIFVITIGISLYEDKDMSSIQEKVLQPFKIVFGYAGTEPGKSGLEKTAPSGELEFFSRSN